MNAGRIPATIVDDYIFELLAPGLCRTSPANRDIAVSQDGSGRVGDAQGRAEADALLKEFFATHKLTF